MSRIAEASALAGCAVPDNPRVNWAKEREAAERLLTGTAAEPVIATPSEPVGGSALKAVRSSQAETIRVTEAEAARVTAAEAMRVTAAPRVSNPVVDAVLAPTPALAAPPAADSIEPPFSWPPAFNLDAIDLSNDPHARDFRRPRTKMERRVEFDDETPSPHRPTRHEPTAASSPALRVSPSSPASRATAASSPTVRTPLEPVRAEAPRVIVRWLVISAALIVLLASAALLMYLLQYREAASTLEAVRRFASSASSTFYVAVGLAATGLACLLWDFLWSRRSRNARKRGFNY